MAIETFISKKEIEKRVSSLAIEIDKGCKGQELIVIGVLNGSFMFVADLIRELKTPVILDFIAVSSYEGTESTGELKFLKDIKQNIEGKHVLVVEDIVDTGLTINLLQKHFEKLKPASLKLATLLHKPTKTEHDVQIDYLGFEIEDKFVIGYGLDFDGKFREMPYIGVYSAS